MKKLARSLAFAASLVSVGIPASAAEPPAAPGGRVEHGDDRAGKSGKSSDTDPSVGPRAQARVITEAELRQELQNHKGRPLVLHFWASWCGPCLSELPTLAQLAHDVERRGIDFIAVSLDSPSPRSAQRVSAVLAQRVRDPHWSSILRIADVDAFMTSIDPRWEGAIPVFFAFDRDSKLRRSHLGNINQAEFEALVAGLLVERH